MYPGQLTPPSMEWTDFDLSAALNDISPHEAFPDTPVSMMTPMGTPPRSPQICGGPRLIPKVRVQDQMTEPTSGPTRQRSRSTGYAVNARLQGQSANPLSRSFSPLMPSQIPSPVSVPSPCPSNFGPELRASFNGTPSRRPGCMHGRSVSTSAVPRHSRNLSNSSIDGSVLTRYGFPTYRNIPGGSQASVSQIPTALNFLTPMPIPRSVSSVGPITQTRQSTPLREASPPKSVENTPSRLSAELIYDPADESIPTSTLLDYLTSPNPSPSLVQRVFEPGRGQNKHFWWDVRNLRSWSDFNMSSIANTPGLLSLLQCEIPTSALPTPGRVNPIPESQAQLHELCRDHFAVKVNAALKVALGTTPMALRSLNSQGPITGCSRNQPEFLSNYASDCEKTVTADQSQRGRVVGIVLCYEQWNSGMRSGAPTQKIRYLTGLSHLHRFMRDHGCRYGFLQTEIELVCVRYGGDIDPHPSSNNPTSPIPNFGFLELSSPIRVSACEKGQLSVSLALWWLHMLAKESPLPGQRHWKLDVSGPAALTRQKCLQKDEWIPEPNQSEKREAKRNRGWVWPEEKLSRRECGRGRRMVFSR